MRKLKNNLLRIIMVTAVLFPSYLHADENITKVFLNHTKFLKLSQNAATVILNNEDVVNLTMENPRLFMLRALKLGETGLKVLDKDYNEILSTTVVVAPEEGRHITVDRVASESTNETILNCGSGRCVEISSSVATEGEAGAGNANPAMPDAPDSGG